MTVAPEPSSVNAYAQPIRNYSNDMLLDHVLIQGSNAEKLAEVGGAAASWGSGAAGAAGAADRLTRGLPRLLFGGGPGSSSYDEPRADQESVPVFVMLPLDTVSRADYV